MTLLKTRSLLLVPVAFLSLAACAVDVGPAEGEIDTETDDAVEEGVAEAPVTSTRAERPAAQWSPRRGDRCNPLPRPYSGWVTIDSQPAYVRCTVRCSPRNRPYYSQCRRMIPPGCDIVNNPGSPRCYPPS
jgi:hypothetical protein